jgi:hypothetical protein
VFQNADCKLLCRKHGHYKRDVSAQFDVTCLLHAACQLARCLLHLEALSQSGRAAICTKKMQKIAADKADSWQLYDSVPTHGNDLPTGFRVHNPVSIYLPLPFQKTED